MNTSATGEGLPVPKGIKPATNGSRKTVLDNGLRVLTQDIPQVHSVSIGLWVDSGSSSEPKEQAGLSHFIEHLLFKGTTTRSAKDIALEIERVGGMLNAFTGREFTCFYIRVLHSDLPLAMEILSDIFYNPLFDGTEMEKERAVILQEIKMVEDTPDDLVHDLLHQNLWGENSFGMPIAGTAGTVRSIQRGQVVDFFKTYYRPRRVILSAAGRLDADAVLKMAREKFDRPMNDRGADPVVPIVPPYRKSLRTHERDLEQIHVCLAFPAFAEKDPRRYPLSLLNTYLGGGMSSQLFQEVREKRGLVYSIYSYASLYRAVGYVGVYAGVGREGVRECVDVTRAEIGRILKGEFTRENLDRTKTQIKGQLLLGMESTFNIMQKLAKDEFLFGRHVPLEEVIANFEAVKVDDVIRTANEIYSEKNLSLTLLGPAPDANSLLT
ncbi:MAG: insulinase family protein [Nitrospirae bacterium]|nr:insulinase family protein [Nitrospirota bacterium]